MSDKDIPYPETCHVTHESEQVLEHVRKYRPRRICEVGAYLGFTTLKILEEAPWLEYIHIFDFQDRVEAILRQVPPGMRSKIVGYGNGRRLMDSYNESLFRLIKEGRRQIYDYAFLDGAHTFCLDGLAFFLLDLLLEEGGLLEFDDYSWSLASSPTQNPNTFPMTRVFYSESQIESQAIKDIVEHLVIPSGRYETLVETRLFRKKS